MAINLTEGAIAMLCTKDAQMSDAKPVLQIADIRRVSTQQQQPNSERYRVVLSDGCHLQQGMLATQRNELVSSERLRKGSIVQLTQFVCNPIQQRMIIIIIDLDVILESCDLIGNPKQFAHASSNAAASVPPAPKSAPTQISMDQSGSSGNLHSAGDPNLGLHAGPPSSYMRVESGARVPGPYGYPRPDAAHPSPNSYARPPQPAYQQPPSMYVNRGPIAKNEAAPRIIPISALNPYQGRWTIKARVTSKGDLRHYNNPRGDGKVFSFDLLDSEGGEIRITCFNAVADQFYDQIEAGKVYLISKGSLKPAQKNFNHLRNDYEIFLENTSTVQPCFEDDSIIPRQQFHFLPISDIEGMDNNAIVDVIGVVSSINPSSSIMRKNGTETQKRILHLKDMSGRSVELVLWGNFCNSEGQTLQNLCDSGLSPVLAVKSGRVNDFSGKAIGTISSSQLFIEPDFAEACKLKEWFDKGGRNMPSVSISREATNMSRMDPRKTISQIKDERLGTSEKPDWILISATVSFIKVDNFCYTACPVMIGERQCNKKVTNNGDGKWRCDRCDRSVDDCDYRYILQFQIQDHTGLTWVTAFQESGEEIMGISAKELYFLKYEEQDEERFGEIIRRVLFSKYTFKLKVKEEMFSDEQRVKSTVVRADKVNFSAESKFLLDSLEKSKGPEPSLSAVKVENKLSSSGAGGFRQPGLPVPNYIGSNQMGQYVGPRAPQVAPSNVSYICNSCGGTGHNSVNCPSIMSGPGLLPPGGYGGKPSSGTVAVPGGSSDLCYKCHQHGHWARDCPGTGPTPAYGSSPVGSARYGGVSRQRVGGF